MKPMDEELYELYLEHDTALEPESDGVNPMVTYQNVLRKAGLEFYRPRTRKRNFKLLLIAAVLAAAILTVAAAVYHVRDAFRGTLDVHSSADGSGASPNSLMDRTGMLMKETQKSGDVEISLRAAVGDERTLKVLVDVTDHSGKGVSIRLPSGEKSDGPFALKDYSVTKADGDPLAGSSNYSFIGADASDSKFSILFDYTIMGDTILGQTLNLHFEDILQSAVLDGTALDMGTDGLYNLVSGFGKYTESDFRLSSFDGKQRYLLNAADTGKSFPLGKDASGITVTAATVKDGDLYLQGKATAPSELDKVLDNAALVNGSGNIIQAADISRTDGGAWAVRFDGVGSLDSLKGIQWRYGAGEGYHTAYKGSWDFSFEVKIEDLTVKRTPNLRTSWEGYDLTVTNLEISPYSLFLQYSTDEETALRMFPPTEWGTLQNSDWMDSNHPVLLTMKDGSTVQVNGGSLAPKGGSLSTAPAGTVETEYEMQYLLDTVIDPSQIVSMKIGNQEIPLNQ